jgi:hypothetical protein
MNNRREVIARLRANYDLDRRMADFCHLHNLPFKCHSSHHHERYKVRPIQLSGIEDGVSFNPQFSLPGPVRINRLFRHSLYSTIDSLPIIEFFIDVLRHGQNIVIEEQFVDTLKELAAVDGHERKFKERNFSGSEEYECFHQYFQKREATGIIEREIISTLTLRYMELCLLLLLVVQKLQSILIEADEDNPFREKIEPDDSFVDHLHDLVDEMAIEYAVSGKCPSDDCSNYFTSYTIL